MRLLGVRHNRILWLGYWVLGIDYPQFLFIENMSSGDLYIDLSHMLSCSLSSVILPWGRNIILLPCNYPAAWGQATTAWNLQRTKTNISSNMFGHTFCYTDKNWVNTVSHFLCWFLCVCGYTVGWHRACGLLTTCIFPCFQTIGHLDYHYFLKVPEEFIRFSWTHLNIYSDDGDIVKIQIPSSVGCNSSIIIL